MNIHNGGASGPFVVVSADYHRNGISGAGFFVGVIAEADETHKLVTWFPEYEDDGDTLRAWQTCIAVVDVDKAASGNVYMYPTDGHDGNNAWRGDRYTVEAQAIREAVQARWDATLPR